MKKIFYTILLCLSMIVVFILPVYAQEEFNLEKIHATAKEMFVKPETLDRLMIRLRALEKNLAHKDEELFMDTYRIISEQYILNNHYSQAYQVYEKCMAFKSDALSRTFAMKIDSTRKSIEERRQNDGTELMNLQNKVQQLQIDNDLLVSKRLNFKKYFSFLVIALSTLFALILVRSALKLIRVRTQLKENKQVMRTNHRMATLGSFTKGLVNLTRQKVGQLDDLASSIDVSVQEKTYSSQISEIKINCKEIIKDLNASGIGA